MLKFEFAKVLTGNLYIKYFTISVNEVMLKTERAPKALSLIQFMKILILSKNKQENLTDRFPVVRNSDGVAAGIGFKPSMLIILSKLNDIKGIQKEYEYAVVEAESSQGNVIDFII